MFLLLFVWVSISLRNESTYGGRKNVLTNLFPPLFFLESIPLLKNSTKAKMEVATKEAMNPISQDMKKGKLR